MRKRVLSVLLILSVWREFLVMWIQMMSALLILLLLLQLLLLVHSLLPPPLSLLLQVLLLQNMLLLQKIGFLGCHVAISANGA